MTRFTGWRITRNGLIAVFGLLVLGAGTYAAMLFVQQRGETVRREEALQIALENLEEESAAPPVVIATEKQPEESPAPTVPPELPQTGLEMSVVVPLALLAYSVAAYVISCRTVSNARLSSVFRVK